MRKMSIKLLNMDNLDFDMEQLADVIFADCIYESRDLRWVTKYWTHLKDNGIFITMTDFHTVHLHRYWMEETLQMKLINHVVWKNEFGNFPKDRFHQCHDDVLIYCKGDKWKFYSDRIQVPKATANTKLNPSGRMTKTATSWIGDCTLTTTSKERVKKDDGHLIRWQKPMSLMNRILLPFTDEGDLIIDPFSGSGTTPLWAAENNRHCVGIEYDKEVYEMSKVRLAKYL